MPLTLLQSQAIDKLVIELVDWLPGSSPWGSFTFADAAQLNEVGGYWPGGSKKRALTELLQLTYERRRDRFCPLLLTIVQRGMSNRQQHGSPVTRAEMDHLNGVIEQLSFKIPELWDRSFLDSLQADPPRVDPAEPESADSPKRADPIHEMPGLYERFLALNGEPDRAKAGRGFESLLGDLFSTWGLAPSRNFRVTGEEIDDSFVLDGATYLVEAKWIAGKTETQTLYGFRQKVVSKSAYTRGVFLAVDGFTPGAVAALGTGQEHRILLLDGSHLVRVLTGAVRLPDVIRLAARHLEQFGEPLLPIPRLTELG
jgi:hypothetical protein